MLRWCCTSKLPGMKTLEEPDAELPLERLHLSCVSVYLVSSASLVRTKPCVSLWLLRFERPLTQIKNNHI